VNAPVSTQELERFRAAITDGLGISLDDGKLPTLAELLDRRLAATGERPGRYLDRLAARPQPAEELGQLARELTVPETYFFRNVEQFRALGEVAIPARLAARPPGRPLRLLSAGCASGEEAWSLAIVATELVTTQGLLPGVEITVEGLDLNPAMVVRARRARYSPWSLREVPVDVRERWFRSDGADLVLARALAAEVAFAPHNLVLPEGAADPWQPGSYDVVFCRNVLMYFTPEHAQAVVDRIARALAPGGFLFLGYAETLRGLSQDFELRHTHGTFYYQRKAGPLGPRLPLAPGPRGPAWPRPPAPSVMDQAGMLAFTETVARASDRIRKLSEAPASGPRPEAGRTAAVPVTDMAGALELMRQERFSDALGLLAPAPGAGASRDPDVALLRAALLVQSGALSEAEQVCRELLALDDLSAGAHYLLALCREARNDPAAAVDQHQTAAHLDPTFAFPRLHLGLLARRAGQREPAERELRQAARLLAREDPSRLLLFGGGFGRDGLIALCLAELGRLGVKP
jgi:chemotaxis protein methyltransferase CheR